MLWDTHMHTSFSGDSDAPMNSMVEAAIACGLDGICITDHLDYDYPHQPDMFTLDLPAYFRHISILQRECDGRLPIHRGIELGLQPHLARHLNQLLTEYSFDFIIGSSHVVHGTDPYYPAYYEGRTEEEAYREYFASIIENVQAFDDFDVYGHIDYVVRYGPNKNKEYTYARYADAIDESLKCLIERGKGIEINTSGFKYGLGHPHPLEDIIKRYRELGGEIITIGSDAHTPEHIAYDFTKVPAILQEAGFRYYTVFKERKPQFLPL